MPDDGAPAPGSLRHLVWLYAADVERPRLGALFAIEAAIAASIRPALAHEVAHARLAFWEEECARLAATLPQHPQSVALLRESRRAGRPAPDLSPLVRAARWDLAAATPATRAELEERCAAWARGLFRHVAAPDTAGAAASAPTRDDPLVRLGAVIEELRMLGELTGDARAGRLRLPLDELEARGIAVESLVITPLVAPLVALVNERHGRLRTALRTAAAALPAAQRPAQRPALVWAALAAAAAERARRALPAGPRAARLDALRDNWSAWRAARRALTHRLPDLGAAPPAPHTEHP